MHVILQVAVKNPHAQAGCQIVHQPLPFSHPIPSVLITNMPSMGHIKTLACMLNIYHVHIAQTLPEPPQKCAGNYQSFTH
jgi:hypothetical protein